MWSCEPRPPARRVHKYGPREGLWDHAPRGRDDGRRSGGRPAPGTPAVPFLRSRKCTAALLLDSGARWSEGEPRQPIEWTVARELGSQQWRIILSAGLTPENVARAVATARPYAVDVNSGGEAEPGRKDPDKEWRVVPAAQGGRRPRAPPRTAASGASRGASSPRGPRPPPPSPQS